MESKDFSDKLRCAGVSGKLSYQRSNLLEDVVRSKIMNLMHSPDVMGWLQAHQIKRRRRRRLLPLRCRASHSDSTDSRDSALQRTSSGSDDVIESPLPDNEMKIKSESSALPCVSYDEELLNTFCSSSASVQDVQHKHVSSSVPCVSSCLMKPLREAVNCDINGINVSEACTTLRISEICGNGIWSKADSAFISVIGVKTSKSSA